MAESSEMIKLSLPLGTFLPVEIRELTEGGGRWDTGPCRHRDGHTTELFSSRR